MLIYLLYPSFSIKPPLLPNTKKSPKLQVLDTGMLNYFGGFQKELFGAHDIDSIYQGKIAEHIVGQELLAIETSPLFNSTLGFVKIQAQHRYRYRNRGPHVVSQTEFDPDPDSDFDLD